MRQVTSGSDWGWFRLLTEKGSTMRPSSAVVGAALTAAALAAGVSVPAAAATSQRYVSCSETALKNAVRDLNQAGGGRLRLARNCVFTLTTPDNSATGTGNGLPVITSRITVEGNGSTIRRSTRQGTPDFRIFQIDSPVTSRSATSPFATAGARGPAAGSGSANPVPP
ncbi:hypothetical protein [Streptomyces sp. NPDC007905]|uniref:hypothetical protein n=1 Tax=Streptomyces sp. NPDC007905 TaxID=3364788 RepID=UPI0036E6A13A